MCASVVVLLLAFFWKGAGEGASARSHIQIKTAIENILLFQTWKTIPFKLGRISQPSPLPLLLLHGSFANPQINIVPWVDVRGHTERESSPPPEEILK